MKPYNHLSVQPFSLDALELAEIEKFAVNNELHNIARLCAELRVLRSEYLRLSVRVGKLSKDTPSPSDAFTANQRYAEELADITNTGAKDAPPVT